MRSKWQPKRRLGLWGTRAMAVCSIIPVFVPHMGCPNECIFCNQKRISGKEEDVTPQKVENIISSTLKASGAFSEIAFYGGSFTAIEREKMCSLLKIAKGFADRGLVSGVRISTRPDAIDIDVLKQLKLYGVKTIELGAQSMNDLVLNVSKRGHTANDVVRASDIIKSAGFNLGLQVMTGLPQEPKGECIATAKKISLLHPNFVRIYPVVVIKDTCLCDMYENGSYIPISIEQAVENCADMVQIFRQNNINVIRIGLNPTEDLSKSHVVSGAYHPSFGQMVYSRVYLRMVLKILSLRKVVDDNIVIYANKSEISTVIGQKRCNITKIKSMYENIKSIRVCIGDNLEKGRIMVQ